MWPWHEISRNKPKNREEEMNITETEASSIPSLFLSFASHVDHVTLRNSCFCSWRVKGLRSENSRYTAFQKRCVCLLVANRPPQGKRHSRKKSGRTGCHADPFTASGQCFRKPVGGHPESLSRPAGNRAIGSVQSVQRVRFLQASMAILGKATRLL